MKVPLLVGLALLLAAQETRVPVADGSLYARTIGNGQVEDQLMQQTWQDAAYDLHPRLRTVTIPTLVIAGDHDFIPAAIAERIAQALPNARLVTLKDCGHFAYLECPEAVHRMVDDFLRKERH